MSRVINIIGAKIESKFINIANRLITLMQII